MSGHARSIQFVGVGGQSRAAPATTFRRAWLRPVGIPGDLESARENRQKRHDFLVGVAGFEPATPASRTQGYTGLSHTPTRTRLIALGFGHRKKPNRGRWIP